MAPDQKSASETGTTPGGKKAYQKPSLVSEPIYETLALACGKLPGQGGVCNAAPRRS